MDEAFAAAIMGRVLGIDVRRLDGMAVRGPHVVDLEFELPEGAGLGVAEVVSGRQGTVTELSRLTLGQGYVPVEHLARVWSIRYTAGAYEGPAVQRPYPAGRS